MTSSTLFCCLNNQSNASLLRMSANESVPLEIHSDTVVLVVTVILAINITVSLFLNILLIAIIQNSPSLRTPPNSHLLNICVNNLLLCVAMTMCIVCLTCNSVTMTRGKSQILSGLQLFLTYNGLLQYWGSFASIGYYRHRTIQKPGLTLRSRRQLVSRGVLATWIISSLLSMTLSLSFAQSSRYALSTLDPFLKSFYATRDKESSWEERVAVSLVILGAMAVGLVFILTSYYSICRTINVIKSVGKNRISPHQDMANLQSDSSDLTLSTARSYRPQYTISSSHIGSVLTPNHKDAFVVSYNHATSSVAIEEPSIVGSKPSRNSFNASTKRLPRSTYGQRRQLKSSWSDASTGSVKSKAPEFTDISIGADLLRFQREHSSTLQRGTGSRRESISLSSAIRNSLAMLVAYLTCSLPLIVVSGPEPAWSLSPLERLHVFMLCRILFFLNAPVYPLWYLTSSVTVRKCFSRLWKIVVSKVRGT